jgi:uncharacterized oligopeptide transporter (OPT) family protein
VVAAITVLWLVFELPIHIIIVLIAIGGLVQNIIATRAQAQTAFNPARVMGILLEGVCALLGGRATATNLTGAGFVAGSGAQAGNLTGDMAYGVKFRVPPRWQWLGQLSTIVPCAIVAAYVFQWIASTKTIALEGGQIAAPIAKIWATSSQIFAGPDAAGGAKVMPPGAMTALLVGAAIGVVYTLVEQIKTLHRWIPCSVGIGLGLILPVAYGLAFFLGGFLMWIVLGRWAKVSEVTLTTIAEGLGGVAKALLAAGGIL